MSEIIECGMGVKLVKFENRKLGLKPYTDYEIVNDQTEIKSELHY